MRKRKYKAWDTVNKQMLYHFLISNDGGIFIIKDPMLPNGDSFGMADMIPTTETVKVLEGSGFIDVNGVELYESDIYTWGFDAAHRAERQGTGKRRVAVVNHSIGNDGDGYHTSGFTLNCGWQDSFEKIGNWWENPEMREEVRAQGDEGGG